MSRGHIDWKQMRITAHSASHQGSRRAREHRQPRARRDEAESMVSVLMRQETAADASIVTETEAKVESEDASLEVQPESAALLWIGKIRDLPQFAKRFAAEGRRHDLAARQHSPRGAAAFHDTTAHDERVPARVGGDRSRVVEERGPEPCRGMRRDDRERLTPTSTVVVPMHAVVEADELHAIVDVRIPGREVVKELRRADRPTPTRGGE